MKEAHDNKDYRIACKDHLISGETFSLQYDEVYDMLITIPKPENDKLPEYYQSKNYISHSEEKKSWFEKTYHVVRKYTSKKKVRLLNKLHPEKGTLLDIGAGTGSFLSRAKASGWEVYGTEPDEQARKLAKAKGITLEFEIQKSQLQRYDVITLWHVLEHIPDIQKQLTQLKMLLSPNGTLIIAVPNYKSFDARYYKSYWAGYDVPRHLWHFSKTAIKKLCAAHNLNVVNSIPMYFDAFYVSLLSEKYKTRSMNVIKASAIGAMSNFKAFFKTGEYSSLIYIIKHQNNDFRTF